jgi:hypothetical protein
LTIRKPGNPTSTWKFKMFSWTWKKKEDERTHEIIQSLIKEEKVPEFQQKEGLVQEIDNNGFKINRTN